MPDPSRDSRGDAPEHGPERSRRAMLALGLAASVSLGAGCTLSDPTVRVRGAAPSPARTPSPSPTPTPRPPGTGAPADATAELALAAAAARLARGPRLSGRQRALLQLVTGTHEERASALASADPAARPTTPEATPSPGPSMAPAATSLAGLADAERRVAGRYRTAALAASGLPALLWGSMSVASSRFALALDAEDPPASGRRGPHRPVSPLSDAEAVAALVNALHASVYGYQLALGKLSVTSREHERALKGLADRRALQDRLTARLVDAGVEVPPAAPAYDPEPEVRDAGTAARLLQRMEVALLPFCGLWLAAAGRPADRRAAFDTLAGTAATAASWGAPLQPWPGWQD